MLGSVSLDGVSEYNEGQAWGQKGCQCGVGHLDCMWISRALSSAL